jgi:glycosyltransferase involved in cell wall biosynthesis
MLDNQNDYTPVNPMGGSELMFNELRRRLPHHLSRVSLFNFPHQAENGYPLIYWNTVSYNQSSVMVLQDQNFIKKLKKIVFVSHWQSERFRQIFKIPTIKTEVIQNACIGVPDRIISTPKDKIKICYTSTPWRGLDVLLRSWEINPPENCELHIFSSTKIYGKEFSDKEEFKFKKLYEKAQSLPNVIYRGSVKNDKLRKELVEFDILAYPSTFEETSCISVIEALSAGLRVITSNLGALPETTEGWARIYPYLADKETHSEVFSKILIEEVNKLKSGQLQNHLENQISIYKQKWSWDEREKDWRRFLESIN